MTDSKSIDDAAQWRAASTAYLELLEDSLRYTHSLQPDQATKLFIALNRFNGEADDDEWITPLAHDLASSEFLSLSFSNQSHIHYRMHFKASDSPLIRNNL